MTVGSKGNSRLLKLAALLALLVTLAACSGVNTATPQRDVSKQNLKPGAYAVRPLSEDDSEDENENDNEDEDSDEDAVEAVTDGGFEAGIQNPYWTATPGLLCTVAVCGGGMGSAAPEDGAVWAWFGGTSDSVTETLEQKVTLPRGDAELEFDLWAGATSASVFTFTVYLDNRVVYTLTSADLQDEDDFTEGYDDVDIDLSDYTDDKAHTLRFSFSKDGLGDTNLSLDNVSLEVENLEDAVQDIVGMVQALPLKAKVERPLIAKLNSATKAFTRNQDKVGANNLKAFTNQVKAQSKGKKKAIATADATVLITSAQKLIRAAQ